MSTTARDALHAFYASHPDVENADGEQLLALPAALLDELDTLLAAAIAERSGLIVIDPATRIRETKSTFPGAGARRCFTTGRNAKGRFANWDATRLIVTPRGHWYRQDDVRDGLHNDTICRGCGHHGHFDYILDYRPCTSPATAEDVQAALSGAARHVQPGDGVSLDTGVLFEPAFGVVRRIYRHVGNAEAADVELALGEVVTAQSLESLTAA